MMVFTILIITLFLPKQPRFRFEYEKGKAWMNKDLVAPFSFAILKTNPQVSSDKQEALKNILPVYQYRSEIQKAEMERFLNEFDIKSKTLNLNDREKLQYKTLSQNLLNQLYKRGVIGLNTQFQKEGNKNYDFSFLENNISKKMNTQEVYTVETAFIYFQKNLHVKQNDVQELLLKLAEDHIVANLVFDERLTEVVQQNTMQSISITRGMVQKGELIVSNGSIIDDEIYQKLESYREAYDSRINAIGNRTVIFVAQFILVGFALSILMAFLFLFRKDIFLDDRQLSLMFLIIIGMLLALTLAIKLNLPSVYYIPFCMVPIIMRILFDTRLALYLHFLVVLIAGFFVPNSFEFAFYQVTAGMVAIFSIKTFVKRERFLVSAFYILMSYFVAFIGISLLREGAFSAIVWVNFIPFLFSVLFSLLAYPIIYAFERVFGITSDVALIELTDTNNKLLRELAFKAPGTFQHSLQVANLAEAAIFKIGGNAILVRAGALYHDIGKMENPQYFIENQNTTLSPHDKLPYEQSAQIIIQHVAKGIDMLRKNQIPNEIIDFVRTHHGNTRVDYFYQSFLKNSPEKFVDENIFRYPGPIPFSKEQGVLMLADSVEAASRSLKVPDAQNINDLVERIINYKLEQNQLDDCDLTLKDIETIKLIFKTMLMSIYHVRIDYAQ